MKKALSLLLAVITIMSIFSINATTAFAASSYSGWCGDDAKYSYDKNTHVLTITGTGRINDFDSIHTSQKQPWDDYADSVKKIVIGEGITIIGFYTFSYMYNVSTVVLPSTITRICGNAFSSCNSLTNIHVPADTILGSYCFSDVPNIYYDGNSDEHQALSVNGYVSGNIVFSDSTKKKVDAVSNAVKTTLTIPDSVTSITYNAFEPLREVKSIVLGKGIAKYDISDTPYSVTKLSFRNSKCDIYNRYSFYLGSINTIAGYANSTANKFAKKNGFKFVDLKQTIKTVPKVTSVEYGANGKATIKWKKCTGKFDTYQIQVANDASQLNNYNDGKYTTYKVKSTASCKLTIKTKAVKYFRIRLYNSKDATKSAWTKVRAIDTLKYYTQPNCPDTQASRNCVLVQPIAAKKVVSAYSLKKSSSRIVYSCTVYRKAGSAKKFKKVKTMYFPKNRIGYYFIHDKNLKPNTKYTYKLIVKTVPKSCNTKAAYKKLDKSLVETITSPNRVYYTSLSGGYSREDLRKSSFSWKKVKGATGYIVYEHVSEYRFTNIFDESVFADYETAYVTTKTSAKSKMVREYHCTDFFLDVVVTPYAKHGDYYYVQGCEPKKNLKNLYYDEDYD